MNTAATHPEAGNLSSTTGAYAPTVAVSAKPSTTVEYPKWLGGSASCMAVALSHPLDLIKVRMQTASASHKAGTFTTVMNILAKEGPRGLYSGLSAGFLRQATYGSTRFAIYEAAKERARRTNSSTSVGYLWGAAAFSGFCGGIVGNPADIANVRMQNERSLPPELRKNYRNALDVLLRVGKEEGPKGYVRAMGPNCLRASGMTAAQLASYDSFKRLFAVRLKMGDNPTTQALSSTLSSLVATTLCNPIDVIKTQTMSSAGQQTSIIGSVKMLTRTEGIAWMWRGWLPSFARLGPHTVATLMLLEQHRAMYDLYVARPDGKLVG